MLLCFAGASLLRSEPAALEPPPPHYCPPQQYQYHPPFNGWPPPVYPPPMSHHPQHSMQQLWYAQQQHTPLPPSGNLYDPCSPLGNPYDPYSPRPVSYNHGPYNSVDSAGSFTRLSQPGHMLPIDAPGAQSPQHPPDRWKWGGNGM